MSFAARQSARETIAAQKRTLDGAHARIRELEGSLATLNQRLIETRERCDGLESALCFAREQLFSAADAQDAAGATQLRADAVR